MASRCAGRPGGNARRVHSRGRAAPGLL
jgi:hypothetical protein